MTQPFLEIREFHLDFPVNWGNNLYEHRILRFNDVITYEVSLIPFAGNEAILDINEYNVVKREFGSGRNTIKAERNKIEIITNAGKRLNRVYYLRNDDAT